ncbi:MAG: MBL fold metallo-hydrolase [Clostridia bacterium]
MKIHWLGHSCFKLEESTGTTVIADPYDPNQIGFGIEKVNADIITLSHQHRDHNYLGNVEGTPTIIDSIGCWEINGVGISSLVSHHDHEHGRKRGENLIFKYRMDGVDICHMGDIGEEITPIFGEAIGTVNVLMIPIGGNFTIDAEEAKEYIDFLMPDIVIPMHFKTDSCELDIDKLDEFLDLFDDDQIIEVDGTMLELDRSNFDGDVTKVVVFDSSKF